MNRRLFLLLAPAVLLTPPPRGPYRVSGLYYDAAGIERWGSEIVPTLEGPFLKLHGPQHYERLTAAGWIPTD